MDTFFQKRCSHTNSVLKIPASVAGIAIFRLIRDEVSKIEKWQKTVFSKIFEFLQKCRFHTSSVLNDFLELKKIPATESTQKKYFFENFLSWYIWHISGEFTHTGLVGHLKSGDIVSGLTENYHVWRVIGGRAGSSPRWRTRCPGGLRSSTPALPSVILRVSQRRWGHAAVLPITNL